MKIIKLFISTLFFSALLFALPLKTNAAYFKNLPYTIVQPNGDTIKCFVSGDEYFNFIHDSDGYTIIQNSDGYYYYAENEGGQVKPSKYLVNSVNPASVGIPKNVRISDVEYKKRAAVKNAIRNKSIKAPHTGTLNNIVIYIKFSDQTEFTITRQVYDNKYNNSTGISLKSYYSEVSYNNFNITSHHFPICELDTGLSYTDSHPRGYYMPYNATTNPIGYTSNIQSSSREATLLKNAVNYIASQVPTDLNIDADNDGNVDNVCFIIRGGNGAWSDLLWAHRYWLYENVYINSKKVWDYTFQPETQNDVQTVCHETFHALGAPDLYHYSYDGYIPAGKWDLMESGFGHMGAFMKWKYSSHAWIASIPEITTSGTYTLHPLSSSTNNCYKIASPNSASQYFVVEYRKRVAGTYENNLPGSGLLVYRINTSVGEGNADGPPDEVYIYRPGGTKTVNGSVDNAAFSLNNNRTQINNNSNPSAFLSNGNAGGLNIYNITSADTTISFTVGFNEAPHANFTASSTSVSMGIGINFTDNSTGNPTSWKWTFTGGTPSSSTVQNPTNIVYNTPGYYNVKLKSTNSTGADSILKTSYIYVSNNILDCSQSIPLTLGNAIFDSTTSSVNNVNSYSCTNNKFYGPEKVYTVNLAQSCNLTISLSNQSIGNLYVMVLDSCDAQSCIAMYPGHVTIQYASPGTYYVAVDGYNGVKGSYNIVATCSGNIGISESQSTYEVEIIPNPTNGRFILDLTIDKPDYFDIKLFDVVGNLVYNNKQHYGEGKHSENIDVSNFSNGFYYLVVQSTKERIVKKLIKY